jgi:hypothetical protein
LFTPGLFHALFLFSFSPELHLGLRLFRCSTLFVLLLEKGEKKPGDKRGKSQKGPKKDVKKARCEQPYYQAKPITKEE